MAPLDLLEYLTVGVLTLIFLVSGTKKLFFNHAMAKSYPGFAQPFAGAFELAAAILLHWPSAMRPVALLMIHCFLGAVLHVIFFGSARGNEGGKSMWQRDGAAVLKPFAIAFVNSWYLVWATPEPERTYGAGAPAVAVHFGAMGCGYFAALLLFAIGPSEYERKIK